MADSIPAHIFHANDVRGVYPEALNPAMAFVVMQAFLRIVPGKKYVMGFDMRPGSRLMADAVVAAAQAQGVLVDSIGMTTTDTFYFALGKGGYDGGIMLTASHNPAQFAGIKFMAKDVVPIDMDLLKQATLELPYDSQRSFPSTTLPALDFTTEYVEHVVKLLGSEPLPAWKLVVDAGNGMAGQTINILHRFMPGLQIVPMYFEPDATFPHHEANPMIPANTLELQQRVVAEQAHLGIAFDGDADRCFVVDDKGRYIPGHFLATVLSQVMLERESGASIVHDYRSVLPIEEVVQQLGGRSFPSRAGHRYLKVVMRAENALFGSESSGHFYFRDTFYAESSLLPFLLVLQKCTQANISPSALFQPLFDKYYTSGELNFILPSELAFADIAARLERQLAPAQATNPDGIVLTGSSWRLSARMSQTQPLLRINIEGVNPTTAPQIKDQVVALLTELGANLQA